MFKESLSIREKMVLFLHNHFSNERDKVNYPQYMYQQNQLLRKFALGNFKQLVKEICTDPSMLIYLDGNNSRGPQPNENFAREIMELFTMGVGNYTEKDIQEAARAFTGWNYKNLSFVKIANQHDSDSKVVLGKTGNFDGEQVIDIILSKEATSEYIASRLYRYFVREDVSPELKKKLGALLKKSNYEIAPFLTTIFLSKDFYSDESISNQVKSPVEFVISTYKKMVLKEVPGIVDFNEATDAMGQKLFFPPNVAGWPEGKSWITPGLLMVRSNFIYDTLFPPINFIAHDRVPDRFYQNMAVAEKIAMGKDVTSATRPDGKDAVSMSMQGDREEDFNTGLASYVAWRKAIEKVKPISRSTAQVDLSTLVRKSKCKTSAEAVEHLLTRFLSVPVSVDLKNKITQMLTEDLGTEDLAIADTYMEEALRNTLHVILSLPMYQLS